MRGLGIKNPMFFMGIVENIEDKQLQGRVQVRAFGIHGTQAEVPTRDLPWAICVSGHYDPNSPLPPMNSFVYGMFIDGDQAQHPLILGLIPTQYVEEMNPEVDGYGVDPEDGSEDHPLFKGFRPIDFGEHQSSKLRRGENIGETLHAQMNLNAVVNQKIADNDDITWSQPPSAYSAKYPYNRVIETAAHTIELDDTVGAERITIHHKAGSFIQIDAIGTVTERAEGDRYEINIGTKHESSASSVVTINGNSHVYVKGNKTEEIEGDYKLIVRGTTEIGSAGSLFLNAGDSLQARGSVTRIESVVDSLSLFGKEQIQMESEKQINLVSQNIKHNALLSYDVFSTKGFKFTTPLDFHLTASNIILNATGLVPPSPATQPVTGTIGQPVNAGLNITAPTVNIAAATGSFSGLWNTTTLNAGVLTATTGNFLTLIATGASMTGAIFGTAEAINLRATSYSGPVGSSSVPVTLPSIDIPTIPNLTPPAISNPAPPVFGVASGLAYPKGNGPDFLQKVLTAPLSFIPGILPALDGGGYGITRCQMPEPPAKSMMINNDKKYSAIGYAVGTYNTPLEEAD